MLSLDLIDLPTSGVPGADARSPEVVSAFGGANSGLHDSYKHAAQEAVKAFLGGNSVSPPVAEVPLSEVPVRGPFREGELWDMPIRDKEVEDSLFDNTLNALSNCWFNEPEPSEDLPRGYHYQSRRSTLYPLFDRRVGAMHVRGQGPSGPEDKTNSFSCVAGPCWPMSIVLIGIMIFVPIKVLAPCTDNIGVFIAGDSDIFCPSQQLTLRS